MEKFRKYAFCLLVLANVLAIIGLLLVGNADLLRPEEWPKLSNAGLLMPAAIAVNVAFLVLWTLLKPRRLWLPVVGLLAGFVPIRQYTPFNRSEEVPHGAIKVLSWNVAMFEGYDESQGRRSEMMKYLLRSRADIICLQEATDKKGNHPPFAILRREYPYTAYIPKKLPSGNGLFVASRYPILSQDTIPYHSSSNLSAEFVLDINGYKMSLISNHLQSYGLSIKEREEFHQMVKGSVVGDTAYIETHDLIQKLGKATAIRAAQARMVAGRVQRRLRENMPVIVAGDFNDTPISYARRTLAKDLTDCYIASGNGPGRSFNRNGIYARIDHILCSDFFKPYGAKVDSSIKTSDHYPIYCWLEIRPKP